MTDLLDHDHRDYYWQPGQRLRPAPGRITYRQHWVFPRQRLLAPWIDFREVPIECDLTRMCADHFWQGDYYMDAVVADLREMGAARGRALFERALAKGIDSVPEAPGSMRVLFSQLDHRPEWFDEQRFETGRRAVIESSLAGKIAMGVQDALGTFVGEEVASSVGATGRFVNDFLVRQLETLKYFYQVTRPAVTDRWSPQFADVIRVRLMHAQARAGLRRSWGEEHFAHWGNPISASMISGAAMTFGLIPILFDHAAGRERTVDELDGAAHYWGYLAHLMGAPDELIPADWREAIAIMDFMVATAGGPNRWTEKMVGAATRGIDKGNAITRFQRRIVWVLPQALVAYYGGEPLRRALFTGTELERRTPIASRALWSLFVAVDIFWNRLRDALPAREVRIRRRAGRGDATLARGVGLIRRLSRRTGHDITATWDGHDVTPTIDAGAALPQVSPRTADRIAQRGSSLSGGRCPMGR